MAQFKLDLKKLAKNGRAGLTPAEASHLAEAAVIAADAAGKPLPQTLTFSGRKRRKPLLLGPKINNRMRRTYADHQDAVEWGASAVAAAAIEPLENLTVYERSPKSGFGFDYFLIPLNLADRADDDNFFADATHILEVSGTLQNDKAVMDERVSEKLKRLKSKKQELPAFVIVVDFRFARAKLVKYG